MTSRPRTKIFTHLWYAKEAEAAAAFYASIFPDSRVDGQPRGKRSGWSRGAGGSKEKAGTQDERSHQDTWVAS